MSSEGMMRSARRLCLVGAWALLVPAVSAQTPPARKSDDLDVTMRVIVDPDAKVPDEIVRRIPLPKPAPAPTTPPKPADQQDKPADQQGKPADSGSQGQRAEDAREKGREFGQQMSEQAKQRADEARRNPGPPPGPRGPPGGPPGRPPQPPRPGG
jgi:hypothetical protein